MEKKTLSNFFMNFGLSRKITLLIVLSNLFIGISTMIFIYFEKTNNLLIEKEKTSLSIARGISQRSIVPIYEKDLSTLDYLVEEEKTEDFAYIFIIDNNNNILAHSYDLHFPDSSLIYANKIINNNYHIELINTPSGKIYDIAYPIIYEHFNTISGICRIGIYQSKILDAVRKTLLKMFLLISVITLLFIILGIFFSRKLVKPIEKLTKIIKEVKPTQLDINIETELINSKDEIGELARSFKSTFNKLKEVTVSRNYLDIANKKIENINKELSDFAYITSHDLKAPLRGINSIVTWISSDYNDKLDDEGRELIKLLINRTDRMKNLIDGILKYSKIGISEKFEEVDLDNYIKEIIDFLYIPDNIEVIIENKLPVLIMQKVCIDQIFLNLISNAVKYIDKPNGKINIKCKDSGKFWEFSVKDNGPGIEEKYFNKIFTIFQTLQPRDEVESTGIGLSIAKKIIDKYGGKIWIESKVRFYSEFFFTIPKNTNYVV